MLCLAGFSFSKQHLQCFLSLTSGVGLARLSEIPLFHSGSSGVSFLVRFISPSLYFFLSHFHYFIVHGGVPRAWCMWRGQKTTRRSWFSPSIVWTLGLELRSTGLAASTVTHRTISMARSFQVISHGVLTLQHLGRCHLSPEYGMSAPCGCFSACV